MAGGIAKVRAGEAERDSSPRSLADFAAAPSWEEMRTRHAELLSEMVGTGEHSQARHRCGAFTHLGEGTAEELLGEVEAGSFAATAFSGDISEAIRVADLHVRAVASALLEQGGRGEMATERVYKGIRGMPPSVREQQESSNAVVGRVALEALREEKELERAALAEGGDARAKGEVEALVQCIDDVLLTVPDPDPPS